MIKKKSTAVVKRTLKAKPTKVQPPQHQHTATSRFWRREARG